MAPGDIGQQAALGSGADFWTTKAVGDVPAITLTDESAIAAAAISGLNIPPVTG